MTLSEFYSSDSGGELWFTKLVLGPYSLHMLLY